ncbi:uncharacterized protein E5676_scaffold279G00060 [Cucumis melo var. makuwa]|uniref:Asp_protease_2 domain-containing protein n=1 Tax=Cucumis melo var. makuwa TaxID=1194695 RepID=A0A5D3DW36_CUCMM|nr:uncharacterized protein E6C27_scaffold280G001140 [Cucumis melo var. makuwa]TYK27639.1 uncharacterized protein E5676_scaffold279G00060 [Cucumis melo var. makuwa]
MVDSGTTHNFITEAEAKRLRLRWEKDSGRMKVVNSIVLPIVGLVKQTMIKLGGWKGPVDFVVVKMDDFDVVQGMEFLLEHQVIPMLSARCLVITGSFPTEPPSVEIPLGALGKMEETIPKDTLCVPKKCHGVSQIVAQVLVNQKEDRPWDRVPVGGKSACEECYYRTTPPELAVLRNSRRNCRVQEANEAEGLETTCVTGFRAYEFPVAPFSLTDAKEGKCCSVEGQINVLGHVVKFHQIEVGKRKIAATYEGRILKTVAALRSCSKPINSNGQSMNRFLTRASMQTELMTKLPIQGATMSYDYLSTSNRKKIEKSRKSLLTE